MRKCCLRAGASPNEMDRNLWRKFCRIFFSTVQIALRFHLLHSRWEEFMQKIIAVYPDRCTACRICEIACSFRHHGEINPNKSRIKVNIFHEDFFFYPSVCSQCEDAWCVEICPNYALQKNRKTGVVSVDESRCVGCRMCIQACPFGAMGYDSVKGIAEKCDLCGGDPECVKNCFYGALEFTQASNAVAHKSRDFAQRMKQSYTQEAQHE